MKPLEGMRSQGKQIRLLCDGRKTVAAENFHRHSFTMPGQVQLHTLSKARKIGYYQDLFILKLAHKSQYLSIGRKQYLHFAAPKSKVLFALRNHALHPPQQRVRVVILRLYIKRFVVIFRINVYWKVKLLRIGAGETGVAVRAPLHGRANTIAIAKIDVVAHADFIAIIKDWGSGQGEQQRVHQFNAAAI